MACYKANRDKEGLLTLDEELLRLVGLDTFSIMNNYNLLAGRAEG